MRRKRKERKKKGRVEEKKEEKRKVNTQKKRKERKIANQLKKLLGCHNNGLASPEPRPQHH